MGKKEGEEKWKGGVGKFSFRVICQNIIPLSVIVFNLFTVVYVVLHYLELAAAPVLAIEKFLSRIYHIMEL